MGSALYTFLLYFNFKRVQRKLLINWWCFIYIYIFLITLFYHPVEIVNNKEKKVNLYNSFNKSRRLVTFSRTENIGGKG